MRKCLLGLTLIATCFISGPGFQSSRKETTARKAAESWLPLLDAQEYGESWERLSPIVKRMLRKEHWEIGLTELRTPLGKLKARELFSTDYIRALKEYPKREGVLVRFVSQFENGAIFEDVGTIHDRDGKWRVISYRRIPPQKKMPDDDLKLMN
jgi:hypothetical protein